MELAVKRFRQALLDVDHVSAQAILTEASAALSPLQQVDQLIVPALQEIGERWERGEAALSQVYMSGRICEKLTQALLPGGGPNRAGQSKLAVTVLEDFHYLGKNMVCSALRASGFDFVDYGHTDVRGLVERVCTDGVKVLLISSLMLPSALKVREVRSRLDAAGARVCLVVGGAPYRFDPEMWREVGADAMGYSALDAIAIVQRLMQTPARPHPPAGACLS